MAGIILLKKEPFSAQIIRHGGWRVLFIGVSECVWRIAAVVILDTTNTLVTCANVGVGRRFVGRSSW